MNQCFLPHSSTIDSLSSGGSYELAKLSFFHNRVKKNIDLLLGETYVLPDVLASFGEFSKALSGLIDPQINFSEAQIKDKDKANKFDIYDKYFEVTRIAGMTFGQFIQQYLDSSAELINEIGYTSMSRGEVAYLLKGWEAANLLLLSIHPAKTDEDYTPEDVLQSAPTENDKRALYRWKLAHHGFAIFMILSGYCLDQASRDIEEDKVSSRTADWIDKAAHLFRSTTACMEFGNSFTSSVYRSVIRPDMSRANEEANLPNGFSGTQNLEYVTWRKKKLNFFSLLKEHGSRLKADVIESTELLRCYYLEDMHIHSIIAGRMVGIEKSLLQEGFGKKGKSIAITAGDMLRMMAKRREEETQFILKLGASS